MSVARIGLLLCSTLVSLCLAVQSAGQAIARVGSDQPVAGERATEVKPPVVPLLPIEVKPLPVFIPEVEYPEIARQAGIEGTTVVEALVDVDGSVTETRVLESSGCLPLDQSAVEAAGTMKFNPAKGRDLPTRTWVSIPFRFALTSGVGTVPPRSISVVTVEAVSPLAEVRNYNDSVLSPLQGLHFVRLKPTAGRDSAHDRMVPDSAAIRFNNEAMKAALSAFKHRRGGFLLRPASYHLQSDWYYLVIHGGRCRVFQRNHPHPSSRAYVYNIDTLAVRPDSLNPDYVELPDWATLPQYVPLKIDFTAGRVLRTVYAQQFWEVQ